MKLLILIQNFFINFGLPKKHKYNINQAKKIKNKIIEISSEENGYARSIGYLKTIDPYVFEELILNAYQDKGHKIKRGRSYSGDGGFDGHVHIDGHWHGIQCKRYKDTINPAHVREFAKITEYGLFVHTGRTGNSSREAITDTNIKFISGSVLIDMIVNK